MKVLTHGLNDEEDGAHQPGGSVEAQLQVLQADKALGRVSEWVSVTG